MEVVVPVYFSKDVDLTALLRLNIANNKEPIAEALR